MQNICCPFMDGLIRQLIEAYRQREELISRPRGLGDLDAMSCELALLHEKMAEHCHTCLMCCRQTYTGAAELPNLSVGTEQPAAMLTRRTASTVPNPSARYPEIPRPLPGSAAPTRASSSWSAVPKPTGLPPNPAAALRKVS